MTCQPITYHLSPQVTYDESVRLLAGTDVLISSPGSDLMSGIYLRPGSAMIVVNYCRLVRARGPCTSLMGLEVHQWYSERGRCAEWRAMTGWAKNHLCA